MSPWQRSNANTRQLSVAQQTCKEVFDDGGDGDGILHGVTHLPIRRFLGDSTQVKITSKMI